MLAPCIKRRGYPFPSQRTPAWTVQKPEYSASRSPLATPRADDTARSASFGARSDEKRALSPRRTPSANPNCLSKDPSGATQTFQTRMQPSRLAEYSQKCTAHPGGPVHAMKSALEPKGTRAQKPNSGKGARQQAQSRTCPPGPCSHRESAESLVRSVDVGRPLPAACANLQPGR